MEHLQQDADRSQGLLGWVEWGEGLLAEWVLAPAVAVSVSSRSGEGLVSQWQLGKREQKPQWEPLRAKTAFLSFLSLADH